MTAEQFYESELDRLRRMRLRRQALAKHADAPSISSRFWYPLLRGCSAILLGLATLLTALSSVVESDINRVRLLALATLFPFAGTLGIALRAPDGWLAALLLPAYLVSVFGTGAISIAAGLRSEAAMALTGAASGVSLLSLCAVIWGAAHYHDRQLLQRMDAVLADDLFRLYEGRLLDALSVVKVDPAARSPKQMEETRHNLDRIDNNLKQIEADLEKAHGTQL